MSEAFLRSRRTRVHKVERILWYLFAGSRGAQNRVKIIDLLNVRPLNLNQVSEIMGLEYKGVRHHIDVLEKNNLVTKMGAKYGALYFISDYLMHNMRSYQEIKSKISQ